MRENGGNTNTTDDNSTKELPTNGTNVGAYWFNLYTIYFFQTIICLKNKLLEWNKSIFN